MTLFSTRLPRELIGKLREFSEISGKKIFVIVREAIEEYLARHNA
jgi:predicted DNA-binding protein